jgi:hypothetical protein
MRNTGGAADVSRSMHVLRATFPFLRTLLWAILATMLILVGLPAALNAAAPY